MSQVQSGILPEHCHMRRWIEANVKGMWMPCVQPAKSLWINWPPSGQIPGCPSGRCGGLGNNVWRQLSGGEGREESKIIPYGKVWHRQPSTMC